MKFINLGIDLFARFIIFVKGSSGILDQGSFPGADHGRMHSKSLR
jgi:hypothetical protein